MYTNPISPLDANKEFSEDFAEEELIVRMGDLVVSNNPNTILTALGIGSCICICAYDSQSKVAGMAHIMLPANTKCLNEPPAKSVDIGIPNLLNAMISSGANPESVNLAVAGGARLFNYQGRHEQLDIGARNIQAVKDTLSDLNLRPMANEVGGLVGRTVKLYATTGIVTVRLAGKTERKLANLSIAHKIYRQK